MQILNHPNTTCGKRDLKSLCITDLTSFVARPDITDVKPDYQFYLGFSNYEVELKEVFGDGKYEHFMSK